MATSAVDQITGNGETVAYKAPVRLATTGNIALSGLLTVDGVVTVADDRVGVIAQTDQKENGVYIVSSGVWRRARDFDSSRDVTKGTRFAVTDGATLAGFEYRITTANPISIGTSNIVFARADLVAQAGLEADRAEEALADFTARYRGTFANDAAANVGIAPVEGALYFNSTTDKLMVFRSGVWVIGEGSQGIQGIQGVQGERDTRNFIWGGSLDWWRRGTSIAGTAGRVGTADGWTIGRSGGETGVTVSQQQGSRGSNFCARVHRTAGNATTGSIAFNFNLGLDDTRGLAGKAAIMTFRARAGANYSAAAMALNVSVRTSNSLIEQAINLTNGAYSTADASATSAVVTLTTSWQTFTVATWTYAADVAQTALRFQQVPTGVAGAADYFEIEEVQIELGTVASTFVPLDPAYSLVKAEQQYRKSYDPTVAPGSVNYNGSYGDVAVTTGIGEGVIMNVGFGSMRAAPTVVLYSPQTGTAGKMAQGSTADIDATATHIGRAGFKIWNGAATVVGEAYFVQWTAEARL
jgi:hypothetical protein